MKYNIISFNMSRYSDWTDSGVVNRNYHILHTLEKDERINKIISVDFLPFTVKKAIKTFIKDQVKKDRRGEIIYGDLTTQVWQVSSKIIVFSTIDSVYNKKRVIHEINKVIDKIGMRKNLLVWNFDPMYVDYFGKFQQRLNIFDAVDNWAEHSSYKRFKERLITNYNTIVDKSDLIYTVSEDLHDYLESPKTHWLPNAVDIQHFQQSKVMEHLLNLPRPIFGFLGILQDRIDVKLIEKIAWYFDTASIVLAGPVWKNFPKASLSQFKNIHFTGAVRYKDIPKYYNSFDVGLILYKQNAFIKSTNSMKYYEYLASGLPVVSTKSGGIERFKDIIYIAEDHDDYIQMLKQAIAENTPQKEDSRKKFVKDMTWEKRIEKIFSDINTLI